MVTSSRGSQGLWAAPARHAPASEEFGQGAALAFLANSLLGKTATAPAALHVRDSKNAEGPRLALSRAVWVPFVSALSALR